MDKLSILHYKDINKLTQLRSGEVKFGEKVYTLPENTKNYDAIANCNAKYVLLGIPEDIGVKANYGRTGTSSAFHDTLKSLINFQHNKFCKGSTILVLGEINCDEERKLAENLDPKNKDDRKKLFDLVSKIDKEVSHVVRNIVQAGKIPIIIGGGHNNAYGNIKGLALAKGKPVNSINFDAHTDFRIMEGRHSGNGFTYAFNEGFLKKYFIFGLHENFVSKSVFKEINNHPERIKFNTYEEIAVRKEKSFTQEIVIAEQFINDTFFGIEIDLDALPNIPSSAMTLTGFSIEKARHFIHQLGKSKNASYIHICEGAPELDSGINTHLTGKLIATLILDFIKSKEL